MVNGDGCSDSCNVENGYICTGGSPYTKDICSCIPTISSAEYNDARWSTIILHSTLKIQSSLTNCAGFFDSATTALFGKTPTCEIDIAGGSMGIIVKLTEADSALKPLTSILTVKGGTTNNYFVQSCKVAQASLLPNLALDFSITPDFNLTALYFPDYKTIKVEAVNSSSGNIVYPAVDLLFSLDSIEPPNATAFSYLNSILLANSHLPSKSIIFSPADRFFQNNSKYSFKAVAKNFIDNQKAQTMDFIYKMPYYDENNIYDPFGKCKNPNMAYFEDLTGCQCIPNYVHSIYNNLCIKEKAMKIARDRGSEGIKVPGELPLTSAFALRIWVKTPLDYLISNMKSIVFISRKKQLVFGVNSKDNKIYISLVNSINLGNVTFSSDNSLGDYNKGQWMMLLAIVNLPSKSVACYVNDQLIISSSLPSSFQLNYRDNTVPFTLCQNCGMIKYFRIFNIGGQNGLDLNSFTIHTMLHYTDSSYYETSIPSLSISILRYDFRESEGYIVHETGSRIREVYIGPAIEWVSDDDIPDLCDIWTELYDQSLGPVGRKCKSKDLKKGLQFSSNSINGAGSGNINIPVTFPADSTIIGGGITRMFMVWLNGKTPTDASQTYSNIIDISSLFKIQLFYSIPNTYYLISATNGNFAQISNTINSWDCIQIFFTETQAKIYLNNVYQQAIAINIAFPLSSIISIGNFNDGSSGVITGFEGTLKNIILLHNSDITKAESCYSHSTFLAVSNVTLLLPLLEHSQKAIINLAQYPASYPIPSSVSYQSSTTSFVSCHPYFQYDSIDKSCKPTAVTLCPLNESSLSICVNCLASTQRYLSINSQSSCSCDPILSYSYDNQFPCYSCTRYCEECRIGGCVKCLNNLVLHSPTECTCPPATEIISQNSATCVPICGDGLKHPSEACDDGNLNNNDGCSSSCQIELGYSCSGGSESSPDICTCTPQIQYALYDNEWSDIVIRITTKIVILSNYYSNCSGIVSKESLKLLGVNSSCILTSDSTGIRIKLGEKIDSWFPLRDFLQLAHNDNEYSNSLIVNAYNPQCQFITSNSLQPFPYYNMEYYPIFDFEAGQIYNSSDIYLKITNVTPSTNKKYIYKGFIFRAISATPYNESNIKKINSYILSLRYENYFQIPASQLQNNTIYIFEGIVFNFLFKSTVMSANVSYIALPVFLTNNSLENSNNTTNNTDENKNCTLQNCTSIDNNNNTHISNNQSENTTIYINDSAIAFNVNSLFISILLSIVFIGVGGTIGRRLQKREKDSQYRYSQNEIVNEGLYSQSGSHPTTEVQPVITQSQIIALEGTLDVQLMSWDKRNNFISSVLQSSSQQQSCGACIQPVQNQISNCTYELPPLSHRELLSNKIRSQSVSGQDQQHALAENEKPNSSHESPNHFHKSIIILPPPSPKGQNLLAEPPTTTSVRSPSFDLSCHQSTTKQLNQACDLEEESKPAQQSLPAPLSALFNNSITPDTSEPRIFAGKVKNTFIMIVKCSLLVLSQFIWADNSLSKFHQSMVLSFRFLSYFNCIAFGISHKFLGDSPDVKGLISLSCLSACISFVLVSFLKLATYNFKKHNRVMVKKEEYRKMIDISFSKVKILKGQLTMGEYCAILNDYCKHQNYLRMTEKKEKEVVNTIEKRAIKDLSYKIRANIILICVLGAIITFSIINLIDTFKGTLTSKEMTLLNCSVIPFVSFEIASIIFTSLSVILLMKAIQKFKLQWLGKVAELVFSYLSMRSY